MNTLFCFKNVKYLSAFCFAFLCLLVIYTKVSAGELSLHALYVNQGDCLILESNHHYMLVDSGFTDTSADVISYLDSLNIPDKKIDLAVSTHPDGDHVGGFSDIFDNYHVAQVIYSPCTKTTTSYTDFISAVKNHGIPFRTPIEGESWKLGDATVTVIYDGSQGTTYNECSIVLRAECDGKSILLMGDLPSVIEKSLMAQGYTFSSDILKVGHHGAGSSTVASFLDAVKPTHAVISCSKEAGVKFPRVSILKKLATRFIKTYRTSDGNVLISIKDGIISTNNKENNGYICIKKGTITLSNNVFYANGKKIKPKVTLTVDGKIVSSRQYKVSYSSNQYAGTATVKVKGTGEKYIGTRKTTFIILPAKEKLHCSLKNLNNIVLNWDAQKNVSGYTIIYSTDKQMLKDLHYINIKKADTIKKTLSKLPYSTTYYFKIRAYYSNLGYGKWCKIKSITTAANPTPSIQRIRRIRILTGNRLKLKWSIPKNNRATGYHLEYSTHRKFKKKVTRIVVKDKLTNSIVIKNLKRRKKYYFRIRGTNQYATGKWSDVVFKKIK